MKYIDADKLRAEIESIHLFPQISADYNDGREDMKMAVLDIIDSLQQEQPEVDLEKITKYSRIKELPEGFEKEWLCYYHKNSEYNSTKFFHLPLIEREYIIARHFYELGLNARKEDTK